MRKLPISPFARQQLSGRKAALLATTALVAVAALLPDAARAQDATWLASPGSGDFNTAANWSPAAVPTGTAFFGTSGDTNLSFSAIFTIAGGWTFNAGAPAYTFTNDQILQFTGAGIVNGGSASIINTRGVLFSGASTAGNTTITTNSGGLSVIADSASGGTARFILNGTGLLDISGVTTGGTTAGSIEGGGSVFLGSNNLAVGGNNLSTTFSGVIQDGGAGGAGGGTGGSLTKTGSGTLTLSGVNTYTGGTTVEAGTLRAGVAGAFVGNTAYAVNGGTLDLNGFNLTMSSLSGTGGTVALGAAALAIDQATDTSYAGALTGTGSLTKTGIGTLTLSGVNTYTGATTLDGGMLAVSGSIASSSITTNSGGILAFLNSSTAGSASITNNGLLTFSNASTAGSATITTNSGGSIFIADSASGGTARFILNGTGGLDLTFLSSTGITAGSIEGAGSVFLSSKNLAVGGNNLSTTFSGVIQDGGLVGGTGGSLTKTGSGTLTLSGVNTYTGGTTVEAGTLRADVAGAFVGNTAYAVNGGTLDLKGFNLTMSSLSGTGGTVALGAAALAIDQATDTSYAGALTGTGSLTKTGFGALTLSGANTYTGATTIDGGTLAISGSIASSSITNNGNLIFQGTGTAGSASITNNNLLSFNNNGTAGSASITNNTVVDFNDGTAGSATITNNGTLNFVATGTAGNASITNNSFGRSLFFDSSSGGSARFILNGTGLLEISGLSSSGITAGSIEGDGSVFLGSKNLAVGGNNLSTTFSGVIQDGGGFGGTGGSLTKEGTGTLTLSGANTYTGGTMVNGGLIDFRAANNFGTGPITLNGGGLQWATGTPTDISGQLTAIGSHGATFDTNGNDVTLASALSGVGGVTKAGTGTLTLSGANSYTGGSTVESGILRSGIAGAFAGNTAYAVNGGTLDLHGFNLTMSSLSGTGGIVALGVAALAINQATDTSYAGALTGAGSLTKAGAGTLTLTGISTYTGATTVDGGTLAVSGSLASSSLLTVNAGGTLGGNGTVGNTTINAGGALAPGNSIGLLTMQGNLTFAVAASYMVEVSPSNADRTNVTGVATLGGSTVKAAFAAGSYVAKQYTILQATGGVTGTFGSQVNTNLPAGFKSNLSYDGNNAYLNVALDFMPASSPGFGGGLNANQARVGTALVNFFNLTGSIPMLFGSLSPAGLTQASGETATGSQQTTFNAMNQFMGVMTDPFVAGRGAGGSVAGGTTGYADAQALGYAQARTPNDALAAIYTKAPQFVPFTPSWSVWAAGFGGSQTTDGNTALGSNNTSSSIYGTAVGADYLFSPDTLAGFALAGGGTNFSVNGQGSGRSDLFQAGAFVRHNVGAAYISAALAYGWQDVTTNRSITVAGSDLLRAEFNANAYSGRVEGGYRFVTPWMGITPYAAGQFTTFDLPSYAERALSGANTFGLAYGAKSVTDPRSELGLRSDRSFALPDAILTLRGRAAWAHDYDPSRAIGATFQTLPGASFVVNGAAQASDSALITASAEMKWINGWSAAATYEGEFSDVTESYAGKGVVRYAW